MDAPDVGFALMATAPVGCPRLAAVSAQKAAVRRLNRIRIRRVAISRHCAALFLASDDPDKDTNIYINSPWSLVTAGLAIDDTVPYVRPRVSDIIVTTSRDGESGASEGSLNLSTAGVGNLEPRPEPEREGPRISP